MKPWKEYLTNRNIIIGSIILGILILLFIVLFFTFRGGGIGGCEPGFADVDGSCVQCEAGTYVGSNLCLPCAEGTYSGAGQDECTKCAKGYYSDVSGSTECTACAVGTYQAQEGQIKCRSCTSGKIASDPASVSCVECGNGEYSTDGITCKKCPQNNQYFNGTECVECQAGKFLDETIGLCRTCEAGTYSEAGAVECTDCRAGTYSGKGGSECIECKAGTYSALPGSVKCTRCGPGRYSGMDSATRCIACKGGEYVEISEATECMTCKENQFSVEGASKCYDMCPPGTRMRNTDPGANDPTCVMCPSNQQSFNMPVIEGGVNTGKPAINPDTGFYQSLCLECPGRQFTPSVTQYSPWHSATDSSIDGLCGRCQSGEYLAGHGKEGLTTLTELPSYDCLKCPANTYINPGASRITLESTITNGNTGVQTKTYMFDEYDDNGVSKKCLPCGPGMTSVEGSLACHSSSCTPSPMTKTYQLYDAFKQIELENKGPVSTTLSLFGDPYEDDYFDQKIGAKRCDDEFISAVDGSPLKLIDFSQDEIDAVKSLSLERLKEILDFRTLIFWVIGQWLGLQQTELQSFVADDLAKLEDGFVMGADIEFTGELEGPYNLCEVSGLMSSYVIKQLMDPFGFATSFSMGCTRLEPDDFMGYFKRTFAYLAFMENSSTMDKIKELAAKKKEEDPDNSEAQMVDDFAPNGALDILTGIVKMIYNLRTLRQVYCANYPCPEESTLSCAFDDFSRHQTTLDTWSDPPPQLPFEKAFGCP